MEGDNIAAGRLSRAELAAGDLEEFQSGQVLTIAGAHFVHDTYSAFLAPLLPLIQERLGTSYAMTGSLAIFTQLPSLLNPFLGYLADKVSLRYFVILAPGVTATVYSLLGLAPSYLMLALLLFAGGITIAAFHAPAPAMIGRLAGNQVGKGMSIFMAGGELARSLGPMVAVAGVGWFGLEGIWRLAFGGWAVSALLYFRLHHVAARPQSALPSPLAGVWSRMRRTFVVITWLVGARALLLVSLTTYLPLYARDALGLSLWLSAASLTILQGAGVVGALFSGTLSDRLGRKRMLLLLLTLSPVLYLLFVLGPAWAAVPLLLALGMTAIAPQPVLLALVQDGFPDHRALANGLYLAVGFVIQGAGIWTVGALADRFGLRDAFLGSGLLAFLSIPAVFLLPRSGR
ncbi:MAG: MFS transporter [Anaerolineae bacterium]|nr:MFS transporter [Anaerolineae bacterium]